MGYFHTSGNIKMLRNILIDYAGTRETSSYEYMKMYIEKCPPDIEDAKLSWIAESFLGLQKHWNFLQEICSHMTNKLSEEEQDYLKIILYAVTFQLSPKDMHLLYKCLFNLSKPLLNTFTGFLSNNEVLTFISQVAQSSYDADYITDKIVGPLFTWQPYISEMAHSYAEYVKKIENRKLKPPTIPVQPNVLNRKGKQHIPAQPPLPVTPPNSLRLKTQHVLTKTVIDRRLKNLHEKNKQKANQLLEEVKSKNYHYAKTNSEKDVKGISDNIKEQMETTFVKPQLKQSLNFVVKSSPHPVKDTAATLKRLNKRIQRTEQDEVEWLEDIVKDCRNTYKIQELEDYDRQEREKKRLMEIEKKHLLGQISHEEAVLAKKRYINENKKKYEDFLREKEVWNEEIEKWKKEELHKCNKRVEKLSMLELNVIDAKNEVALKKKEMADKYRKESEIMLANAMKEKQEELDQKIKMIQEIKILTMVAKTARIPKVIDLTETSGIGLLCEMSIAELLERLSAIKINIQDELDNKRKLIKEKKEASKQELEDAKKYINNFINERVTMRKRNKRLNSNVKLDQTSSKEINDLKKVLEEKRKLRIQLSD